MLIAREITIFFFFLQILTWNNMKLLLFFR